MIDYETWNWLRLVNSILGFVAALWLLRAFAPLWSKLNQRERSNGLILMLFTLTLCSRSYLLWTNPQPVTIFVFFELLLVILVLRHCWCVTTRRWPPTENTDFRDR